MIKKLDLKLDLKDLYYTHVQFILKNDVKKRIDI